MATKFELFARQGDVLLFKVKGDRPEGLTDAVEPREKNILAFGEVTGHKHEVHGCASFFKVEKPEAANAADRYFTVSPQGGSVVHDEHSAIAFEPGEMYCSRIQREYSPEAIRNVLD